MTNEERDIISQFIARVGGAQAQPSSFSAGSVPATQQPALPPVDPEADRYITSLFDKYPEARYRITQLAFVQEHALTEAQNRIKRLEWELQQAQQAFQQAQAQPGARSGSGGGFFSGLFGGGNRQQAGGPPPGGPWNQGAPQGQPQQGYYQPNAAPPPPQYAPNYQQGMFQRPGSGFLGSALTTAAGVAGGVVAGNALMNLFSGHSGSAGGLGGPGFAPGGSPWGTPGTPSEGYVDTGNWSGGAPPVSNQDYVDNGNWDQSSGDSGWSDNSGGGGSDPGGGWDDNSSGGGSDDTF